MATGSRTARRTFPRAGLTQALLQDPAQDAPKQREWIALAVALTTQCGYCLDVHSKAARRVMRSPPTRWRGAAGCARCKAGWKCSWPALALDELLRRVVAEAPTACAALAALLTDECPAHGA